MLANNNNNNIAEVDPLQPRNRLDSWNPRDNYQRNLTLVRNTFDNYVSYNALRLSGTVNPDYVISEEREGYKLFRHITGRSQHPNRQERNSATQRLMRSSAPPFLERNADHYYLSGGQLRPLQSVSIDGSQSYLPIAAVVVQPRRSTLDQRDWMSDCHHQVEVHLLGPTSLDESDISISPRELDQARQPVLSRTDFKKREDWLLRKTEINKYLKNVKQLLTNGRCKRPSSQMWAVYVKPSVDGLPEEEEDEACQTCYHDNAKANYHVVRKAKLGFPRAGEIMLSLMRLRKIFGTERRTLLVLKLVCSHNHTVRPIFDPTERGVGWLGSGSVISNRYKENEHSLTQRLMLNYDTDDGLHTVVDDLGL